MNLLASRILASSVRVVTARAAAQLTDWYIQLFGVHWKAIQLVCTADQSGRQAISPGVSISWYLPRYQLAVQHGMLVKYA